jgi:hypothetical protein
MRSCVFTASIEQGTVTASLILHKLAAYPRQNSLATGLRASGRLKRTLFTLKWLRDPALRRRVTGGLNKGEAQNATPTEAAAQISSGNAPPAQEYLGGEPDRSVRPTLTNDVGADG